MPERVEQQRQVGSRGLVGLQDRVEALGGTMTLTISAGARSTLTVTMPAGEGDYA